MCKNEDVVKRAALASVRRLGGNVDDQTSVLGQYELQFGLFRGKTFKWLVENGLGYAAWLVDNLRCETSATAAPLSKNKHAFRLYLNSFPEGRSAVGLKKEEKEKKASTSSQSKIFAGYIFRLKYCSAL